MKRCISILILITVTVFFAAAASWEGRATVGTTGSFPGTGMYGLSRVFPIGEMVEVFNPINNSKATVVISNNTDLSGVLILLSPEAAAALGITPGSDSLVRVSNLPEYAMENIVNVPVLPVAEPAPEKTVAAAETAPVKQVAAESTPTETLAAETAPAKEEVAVKPVESPEPAKPAEEKAVVETITVTESTTITEKVADILQKEPETIIVKTETVTITETPSVVAEKTPEAPKKDAFNTKTEYEETTTYVLVPAENKPPLHTDTVETPKKTPLPEAVSVTATPVKPAVVVENTKTSDFYVQLAYYTDTKSADSLVNQFKSKYPMRVNKYANGLQVLVGPLNVFESNTVLQQFKNKGYKDAFIKVIQ